MTSASVRESGPDTAPTILFLHGGGVSGWMWDDVTRNLGDFHCLVPDLPGHGPGAGNRLFSIAEAIDEVADLITHRAHGAKAHVVGLSLGAQVLVAFLPVHPGLVLRAVISGALVRPLPGAWLINAMMALYGPFKDMPLMIRANMKSYDVPVKYYEQFAADTKQLTTSGFAALIAANMTFSLPAGLDRVTMPVLVTAAEREYRLMKRSARTLAATLPDAIAMMPEYVGHNWPLEAPGRFAQVVRAWVVGDPLPDFLLPLK